MISWASPTDWAPAPWWVCGAVAAVGLLLGGLLARSLATGGYRLDDEADRRRPFSPAVVVVAVPLLWTLLALRLGAGAQGALLPAYLLVAWLACALTWVDLDVHRLPEGLTLPAVPALVLLLAIASATTGDWGSLLRAATCGLVGWLVYLGLALAVPGGLGLGDATVGGLVAFALGYLGWGEALAGFVLAYLVAGLVVVVGLVLRRLHLRSAIAFGPYILLGALLALLVRIQVLGG